MQVCPVAPKMPASAPTSARSKSASLNTMLGDFPPSSSVTGLRLAAAAQAMARPTPGLPVKLILSTAGLAVSAAPTAPAPVSTCTTPAGKPACSTSRAISSVVTLACSLGFTITQLPAARAAGRVFVRIATGLFHAVMQATTPKGSRMVKSKVSFWSSGITAPCILSAQAA